MGERDNKDIIAIVPLGNTSKSDRDYAERMGIFRVPKWVSPSDLSRVEKPVEKLPAANVESSWGLVIETRTHRLKRLR